MKEKMVSNRRSSRNIYSITFVLLLLVIIRECNGVDANNDDHNYNNSNSLNLLQEEAGVPTSKNKHNIRRGDDNDDWSKEETNKQSHHRKLNYCGMTCSSNDMCAITSDGCKYCNGFECYNPNKCDMECNDHSDCSFSIDGCYFCNNQGRCSSEIPYDEDDRTCIRTNALFQSALNNPSATTITLCRNIQLVLRGNGDAFTSNRSGFTITCQSGGYKSCGIIRVQGSGRLLNINGGSISIIGVTFDHGSSNDDGGAIYMSGSNNSLENCIFRDNRSLYGNGGAVSWNSGSVNGCTGFNNVANAGYCNGVYSRSTGQCNRSVNRNTQDQCDAYCDNTNMFCNRVGGVCGACDLNTNTCIDDYYPPTPTNCGISCQYASDCTNPQYSGPCTVCSGGTCINSSTFKTCARNESMLRTALQATTEPAIVEICQNHRIDIIDGELFTSVSNKTLRCQGGARTCTLVRPSEISTKFRLLHVTGNNFALHDITIQNGVAPNIRGDGGGVLLEGTNNEIVGCEFIGNKAPTGRGGALSYHSGIVVDCQYEGNSAAQCMNTFWESQRQCLN